MPMLEVVAGCGTKETIDAAEITLAGATCNGQCWKRGIDLASIH